MESTDVPMPQSIPERDTPWYDDGNIVLQADWKQFRVHRSILSANSVVFKDMFSLPQPKLVEDEIVDGCPVVHLSDSATDLRYVLKAFYNGRNYPAQMRPEVFPVVAAFLRLGKKYEIPKIYEEAISRLRNDYPPTLGRWDQRVRRNAFAVKYYVGIFFDVVNLAREIDIPSLLPAAFYFICAWCSTYPPENITKGFTRKDGTISIMSTEDQLICLVGRQKLFTQQAYRTLAWIDDDESSEVAAMCEDWSECEKARRNLWFNISRPAVTHYPLDKWDTCFEEDLCVTCIHSSKIAHARGRVNLWDELPIIFGLPDWKELVPTE